MKFKIDYKDMRDEDYPISPLYSIEAMTSSEGEAIEKFKYIALFVL